MSALDLFLLCCVIIGSAGSYFVGALVWHDKGVDKGRRLEAEDQINRRAKYGWTVFDRSRKTFPGMSEVKAQSFERRK